MCAKQGFCQAAGLEQGVAQQDRIAHAAPDGRRYVVAGCGDALHQHGIDAHTDHNEEGLEAQGQQGAKIVLPRGVPLPVDHCGKGNRSNGSHQIYLNHSAVDHQEDADGKYLRTQPHEHALEPQPQQGTHAPVGKLGLQIAHHAGDVDARIRDDDPRRLADHILRHIEHRHDDVPGVRDDQHRAEGFENPLEENPGVEVVEVVLLDDELDQLVAYDIVVAFHIFPFLVFLIAEIGSHTGNSEILAPAVEGRNAVILPRYQPPVFIKGGFHGKLVMLKCEIGFRCAIVGVFRADMFECCQQRHPLSARLQTLGQQGRKPPPVPPRQAADRDCATRSASGLSGLSCRRSSRIRRSASRQRQAARH